MKKILMAAVAAVALVGSAFALDVKVDASMGLPVVGGTQEVTVKVSNSYFSHEDTSKVTNTTTAFALDFGAELFFNDLVGIGVRETFGFPIVTETKYDSNTTKTEYGKEKDGVTSTAFSFNSFVGCALRPLNKEKFYLIAMPGLDLNVTGVEAKAGGKIYKSTFTSFGIGGNVQFGYNLTKNLSLTAEMLMAFNFVGDYTSDNLKNETLYGTKYEYNVKYSEFIFIPKIGASYTF